jgi:hypothetical protein
MMAPTGQARSNGVKSAGGSRQLAAPPLRLPPQRRPGPRGGGRSSSRGVLGRGGVLLVLEEAEHGAGAHGDVEHHGRHADAGGVGPVHRAGPGLGGRVEAAGGAGAALQALEHDLAGGVHARGVHGEAARGRGRRRAAPRGAAAGAGGAGGGVAVVGGADEPDAGRVGVGGGVEGEAGHVVVLVAGGGGRRGEREAGGREGERRLRVGAVAEQRRRREVRRRGPRRAPGVPLEQELERPRRRGVRRPRRRGPRSRDRRRRGLRAGALRGRGPLEPEQLAPPAGAAGRLGREHVGVGGPVGRCDRRGAEGLDRPRGRRHCRLRPRRRRGRRRRGLRIRQRRGRLPQRQQLPVREQLVRGEHGGGPAEAELEVDEVLGDRRLRRGHGHGGDGRGGRHGGGLHYVRALRVVAEGHARAEPPVRGRGGGREVTRDGGGHGPRRRPRASKSEHTTHYTRSVVRPALTLLLTRCRYGGS